MFKIEENVKEMLYKDIMRPSCISFYSPLVVVLKKDASERICVDYRQLNNKNY